MDSMALGGKDVEQDEEGFMLDPDLWDHRTAIHLARAQGIDDMTEEHWRVVTYIRNCYAEFRVAPMVRQLCNETGCSLKRIYELFPLGPVRGAFKVAGLPRPNGCISS
jgi:dissimilatory sulfite reductase related protein